MLDESCMYLVCKVYGLGSKQIVVNKSVNFGDNFTESGKKCSGS